MSTLYDITPSINEHLAVWPGDRAMERELLLDMEQGDNITLSSLRGTVHLGAHADGPNHYGLTAEGIGERALDSYLGPCRVVEIDVAQGKRFTTTHLGDTPSESRILFKTGTFPDPTRFHENFAAPAPELIDALAREGVRLIGVDTPSVDLFESKDLPSHKRCLEHDISILEGLYLKDVPEGTYELIALPLKLIGFDASPVRAVLRSL